MDKQPDNPQPVVKQRATRTEQLPDGTWMYTDGSNRNEHGQLVVPHPDGAKPITRDNSRDMRALYEKQVSEQVRANLPPARMGRIADHQAELAEQDDGHVGVQAARFVFQAAGHHGFVRQGAEHRAQSITINVTEAGADAVGRLLDRLGEPPSQVVDAEYTELD
jgi:hypothetical protein